MMVRVKDGKVRLWVENNIVEVIGLRLYVYGFKLSFVFLVDFWLSCLICRKFSFLIFNGIYNRVF